MNQPIKNTAAFIAAQQRMREAAELLQCAAEGHAGVNIAVDDKKEHYLCEKCMEVYSVDL